RFTLIAQYFNLVRYKKIKTHRREQLKQTSFIHRLARQKLSMRKISRQEYYQTRAEYLRAQSLYQEAQEESIAQDETLANLLGDDLKSTYKPSEQLKFIGLNTSKKEALTLALRQSATYKQAKSDMENANRTFQKTIKESLPLPEVKLNLGAYKTSFSKGGSYTQFENPNGDRDVEIVASVNLTWNIIGEGGAFNSRHRKRAYLEKRINEEKFFNSKRKIEVGVYTILRRIRFLERKSEVSESQLKNSRNAFDATLDNYMSGKTRFSDLKIALDRSIEAYVNFEDSKYEHLIRKLELAERMGIEDFPGANFENLAQRY
ncbi:MAG: outer membrane protein TolC, partial [Thermoproteota archaeon]